MSIEEKKAERIRNYERYRVYADAKGVSDFRVAKDTGIYNVVFSEWKSGKSQPKIDKLLKIASYLETTVEKLIG